jgi:vacuolar iron transporter family protein
MTTMLRLGKPASGIGHYLRDIVYGALDGVITTLVIIAGSAGADLEPRVGLILGLANLIADGLSMGASNYLALKSELEQKGESVQAEMPWRHGLATFASFAIVGATPLLAYLPPGVSTANILEVAAVLAFGVLIIVGCARARHVRKSSFASAAEVVAVGVLAAGSAFAIGAVGERFTR